jgi:epoxyqueuosine reductase
MHDYTQLVIDIKRWGKDAGFSDVRICDVDLSHVEKRYHAWIEAGHHGEMAYMETHGSKRYRPDELLPGTVRVISLRMDYLPRDTPKDWRKKELSHDSDAAVISVYARGRDYHKVLRQRLQQLADTIAAHQGDFGYRVFTDSAPVMEVALAEKSGLGWRGKHTLLLTREAGSMFFLGEILIDIPLPVDPPTTAHCGQCTSCMTVCPTQAIVAPYQVDARRCISYLTIELHGSIPVEFRSMIGNRAYGCDDCQTACPWNKFAQVSTLEDFDVRHGLDCKKLIELFNWSEQEFLSKMEGSPIRRIGYERWLRNLAVCLGNVKKGHESVSGIITILQSRLDYPSEMVQEHVQWALLQHQ